MKMPMAHAKRWLIAEWFSAGGLLSLLCLPRVVIWSSNRLMEIACTMLKGQKKRSSE